MVKSQSGVLFLGRVKPLFIPVGGVHLAVNYELVDYSNLLSGEGKSLSLRHHLRPTRLPVHDNRNPYWGDVVINKGIKVLYTVSILINTNLLN